HPRRAALQRRAHADLPLEDRLHADADRELRRSERRVLLVPGVERLGERAAAALHAAWPGGGAVPAPGNGGGGRLLLRRGFAEREGDPGPGREGAARGAWPARWAGRALGAVDARPGRDDADGGDPRGDAAWGGVPRARSRPGVDRGGEAGGPGGAGREPAGEHPELGNGAVGHGERGAVRRVDHEPGGAGDEGAGEVLVGEVR